MPETLLVQPLLNSLTRQYFRCNVVRVTSNARPILQPSTPDRDSTEDGMQMNLTNSTRRGGTLLAVTALLVTMSTTAAAGAEPKSKSEKLANQLVKSVSSGGANRHLIALQRIADQNGGNRADQTPGYEASVDYVAARLAAAGFIVSTPEAKYEEEVVDAESLVVGDQEFQILKMSESIDTPVGGITGPLVVVPEDATTGCEATDFAGQDFTGSVALIRRGGCSFEQKALNAAAAGSAVVAISNNVAGPLTNVTITNEGPVPVGGVSQEDGTTLAAAAGSAATVEMLSHIEERITRNVIAQTTTGKVDNVVMAGAHLDSVPVGAGINDNGTGSASLLELALKMGGAPKVNNAVRFAWWGAEELGLLGSEYYVSQLTFEQQLDISMYLNFDMVGSPNAAYFVYDGDDSDDEGAGPGPFGSAQIEATLAGFLNDRIGIATQGTDFDGRSDYGPFIAAGIPSGGLFSGAEDIKTAEQAALWGGTAGVAYDPCYHSACDNLGNVDRVALDRNLDAIAWTVGTYAYSTEAVNGVPPRQARADARAASRVALTAEATAVGEAA